MSESVRERMAQVRAAGESMLQRLNGADLDDKQAKPATELEATWSISLDTTCPSCKEEVDLLETPDFWEDSRLQPIENHTARSSNLKVTCPKCSHEFEVRCVY